MFELELDLSRKGRIWLDEEPPATFPYQEIHEVAIGTNKLVPEDCEKLHSASLELLVFRGSRPIYGFLGASFSPENAQDLLIQVGVGVNEVGSSQQFLAVAPEILQIGLSEEYAPIILKEALQVQQKHSLLPPGRVVFNCGVHGAFSSNPAIFRFLCQAVMLTLGSLCKEASQDEVLSNVKEMINSF